MQQEDIDTYNIQSALQQQNIDSQSSMYAPQTYEQVQQHQAILVEQTNPKVIVKSIIMRLRGIEENEEGEMIKVAEEKVNKSGIDNIWFILDSHINQNIILSHLTDKEIVKIMDSLQKDVVDDLSLNWKSYGIKKKTDLDTINNSILVNIFMALKRAEGQNEKNWLGKVSVENISGGKPNFQKQDSFWSKFRL